MRLSHFAALAGLALAACEATPADAPGTGQPQSAAAFRTLTFEDGAIFPESRGLQRPESGVVLPDGTVVVVDQRYGLAAIAPGGQVRPFGDFAKAGYVHVPPELAGGPNGVSLEAGGQHLLVADVFSGALYRTEIATEVTTRIYRHPYGINYAHRDSTGAIWFTQSTENAPPASEERLFHALDAPLTDGALFRIAPVADDMPLPEPEMVIAGLQFANGFVIDETRGELFIAETVGGRVLGFRIDVATGALTDQRVIAEVTSPDNVELASDGMLWVASPMANQVMLIDPDTGKVRTAFSAQSRAAAVFVEEFNRRAVTGEPRLELLSPDVWEPMPGLVTGVILTPGGGPVYISGLGDALLKIEAAE
ncbi:MAG: SMP-30/gluconolactonase/LRE family protein [Hyphomonas sp.]